MKNKKYFLKQISNYAIVGGMGAILITSFSGCEQKKDNSNNNVFTQASQTKGAFVVIEKEPDGSYKIVDEYPSDKTTIILRENGTERILSKDEIDALVAQEARKIDQGRSNLTNPNSFGGMSLGETLPSSAAGAIIGSYIGNKLFNNPSYQSHRRASYKSPSVFSRSINSFKRSASSTYKKAKSSIKRSGFFRRSSTRSSSRRSSFFGG